MHLFSNATFSRDVNHSMPLFHWTQTFQGYQHDSILDVLALFLYFITVKTSLMHLGNHLILTTLFAGLLTLNEALGKFPFLGLQFPEYFRRHGMYHGFAKTAYLPETFSMQCYTEMFVLHFQAIKFRVQNEHCKL